VEAGFTQYVSTTNGELHSNGTKGTLRRLKLKITIKKGGFMTVTKKRKGAKRVEASASPARLDNIHPGEILRDEFLVPMGISVYRLAQDIKVPQTRLSEIIHGNRSITADTALRLSKYFGNSAKFWLGLQNDYDIEELMVKMPEIQVMTRMVGFHRFEDAGYRLFAGKPCPLKEGQVGRLFSHHTGGLTPKED
jgi:addiction module HigA family antidote